MYKKHIFIRYDLKNELIEYNSFEEIDNYDKIDSIHCCYNYNKLTSLLKLPNSLKELYCQCNQISELPKLPNSLEDLNCSNNKLKSLPKLPNSLEILICNNNQLTELPELPNSLERLYCEINHFIKFVKHKYLVKIIF